jgi:Spy/CpxP family protein refolding chaperone
MKDIRFMSSEDARRHRIRRALHELMADPRYRLEVKNGKLAIKPKEALTPEAQAFIETYKADLIQHVGFLGERR